MPPEGGRRVARWGWASRRLVCGLMAFLGCAASASAQIAAQTPPGPYAFDVHAATAGIPQSAAFYPQIPAGTIVPTRGFGIDFGGHLYAGRLGPARLGFGASFAEVRGTASTAATTTISPTTSSSSGSNSTGSATAVATATAVIYPDITSSVRLIAPQLSFNFGTGAGWSYLSGGLTLARVDVEASAVPPGHAPTSGSSGNMTGFNVGFGARWFLNRHLGASFDVRFHRLSSGTIFAAAAGVSLK